MLVVMRYFYLLLSLDILPEEGDGVGCTEEGRRGGQAVLSAEMHGACAALHS